MSEAMKNFEIMTPNFEKDEPKPQFMHKKSEWSSHQVPEYWISLLNNVKN